MTVPQAIRSVPVEHTRVAARAWCAQAGISRVVDITHLDRVGCPVFASIRPRSLSSTVAYGKGLRRIDAEVGALMEAIELYFAEPTTGTVASRWGTARDIAGDRGRPDAILDFAPLLQTEIRLDAPLLLVTARDIESGQAMPVPAELVYFPAAPPSVAPIFGASTNGLASGNSLIEATVHGLTEVIERDIWSFENIRDTSHRVDDAGLPAVLDTVREGIQRSGLGLRCRYVPNAYELPFFVAFLFDPATQTVKFFNGGWGCHFSREIALVSAVCEAAQGRLAVIHGLRDFSFAAGAEAEQCFVRNLLARAMKPSPQIRYEDVPDHPIPQDPEDRCHLLISHLRKVTAAPVLRVAYTAPNETLQVVRIIVPTLEHFRFGARRVGSRLRSVLAAQVD